MLATAGLLAMRLVFLATTPGLLSPISVSLGGSAPLDQGYREMYNLEFDEAHRSFGDFERAHADDPFGPTSDAAAYLFDQFDRLGVLQTELFVDDEMFLDRAKPTPDTTLRDGFKRDIAQSEKLADAVLQYSPRDHEALLASVLNLGLESNYLALVEKRNLAALTYTKRARLAAEKLLAVDPTCYDAYLAIGIENYILSLKPAPVRWLLRLYGAETDQQVGVQKLELTASRGHYLLPFARLLLAVAALRAGNRQRARELLQNLAQAFPKNPLYRRELARLQ